MVARQRQAMGVLFLVVCGVFASFRAPCLAGEAESAKLPRLLKEFLAGPMAGVDEIIFACRQLNYDPHWYANFGYYAENKQDQSDRQWPSTIEAAKAIQRRCSGYHNKKFLPLPRALSDGYLRHKVLNLTRPEKSLVLLAPLSSEAGGYGICRERGKGGEAATVFADTNDPDYQKILALCIAGKKHLDKIKRFDMPGFRPLPSYVREMKRYGILPKDLAADADIDVYATDQAYWRSLWYKPDANTGPGW